MSANHNFIAAGGYDEALLRLIDLAVNDNAITVAIVAGGTGYTVGDILDVTGGTVVNGLSITLEVTSVAAGVIDGIRIFNCGAYSAQPGNPVAVTGGTGGNDATFNLTFEAQNWTVLRNDAVSTSAIDYVAINSGTTNPITLEREVILQGPGNAGTDEIFVGIMELRDVIAGVNNWHIAGFTGFGTLLDWLDQPGFSLNGTSNQVSSFVPLSSASIECWIHVSPRFIKGVFRMGTTYTNFCMGFLNPYATPSEFPYPLYIGGSSGRTIQSFTESGVAMSGLCDPMADTRSGGNVNGNAGFRNLSGVWASVLNWTFAGAARAARNDRSVYPCSTTTGGLTFMPVEDRFIPGGIPENDWLDIIPNSATPGIALSNLFPTPDSGGDQTQLVPCYVWERTPTFALFGELPDIFWGSTSGANIVSEDRVIVNGQFFRAFQQGNRTDAFAFVFLREDF